MRTVIMGAVCVGGILLFGKGLPRFFAVRRTEVLQRTIARARLSQERLIVANRGYVLESLDKTTTAFLGLSPAFLTGSSASQAAAMLASVITDAADANGVAISSLQPGVDSSSHSLIVPVVVSVSGTGDIRGVSGMLRDLEAGIPLVDVREITIAQSDPNAPGTQMETLHIALIARGLYRRVPDAAYGGGGQ